MKNVSFVTRIGAVLLPLGAVHCQTANAAPTQPTAATLDTALSRDKTTAALSGVPSSGADCRDFALVAGPIAAPHLEDPKIQQTVGRATIVSWGPSGERSHEGVALATVVGKLPSGELLGNHHMLFAEGGIRSQNDVVTLTPTADKCVFDGKVKMIYHDGTGEYAGYSGAGVAEAKLNFCGGVGRAVIYGRICKDAAK
ncbi:MAG TPA: hypothetical protein VIF62_29545 [Labilithrix sp.]|jgi:hypothetical protein